MPKTALIAGATGATAKRLVEVLLADPDWSVVGVSRNPPASSDRLTFIAADLLDPAGCRRAFAKCSAVTHVFYTARAKFGEGGVESVEDNAAMLRNVIDAIEPAARGLQHVHLVQGGKYYGQHLGPYPTPTREDDPRHMPPNFYYDQQDILVERQRGKSWTWSASRPNLICDFAPDRARNIVSLIGAYAAICAELDVPFDFPGRPGCWNALTEVTDATHFAQAMVFMATAPTAANEAFNITNGDLFRWKRLWPWLADHFGVRLGEVRTLTLADWMKDKEPVWQRIVQRHALKPSRLSDLAVWDFGDFVWRQDYDVVSSNTKVRRAGFHAVLDTHDMFLTHLARYRDARILP
jgi:nucleoside-diphosphate-sugar epimerase